LKRETIAVGASCLLLGGLIGYIIGTQVAFKQIKEAAQSSNRQEFALPSSTTPSSIPETPPTVTTSADLDALKKALEAAPENLSLLTGLANKLYDAARYKEAIPYYRRALRLEPHNVNISTDLGTALFYAGQPDDAIAQFNRSLQIDPNHIQTLHNLVIVNLNGKKDVNAAREALDRLKSVDPNNPSIPSLQSMLSPQGTSKTNPRQTLF
jgi:cytochrome c-type biogenesis protein CcmH/NrfG